MTGILVVIYMSVAYLLGSVSMARIISKKRGVDIYKEGSGNPGTTNALRVLGLMAGIITLLFDFLKGFVPVFILIYILKYDIFFALAIGVCAVIGHDYPIFSNFKGGKGVATSFGVFCAFAPLHGLYTALFFISILSLSKIMSLSTMMSAGILGLFYTYLAVIKGEPKFLIITALVLLLILRHRANIERLLKGEEKKLKIGEKK